MSVDITLRARDEVTRQIDNMRRSVGDLNKAFATLEATSGATSKILNTKLKQSTKVAGMLGKGFSSVGKTLTNSITKPALVAGTALGAMVLKAGFSRFTKIDEARAKLKGLGHDANSVNAIMDNALQSVIGTQYNLDEAANTAASAVAAGIKPGQDLTRYLSTITDASAIAGVSMAEMGNIFNRVAANEKASALEINQLADRGVPIWQYLAKTTGKSVTEVRSDLRAGKIDIQTFRKAIEDNIGGAAKKMGKISWSGAIANFKAAIGRIGGNLWGATDDATSVSHVMLQAFTEVLVPLEKIENKAAEMGKNVGGVLKGVYDYMKNGQLGDDMRIISPDALKVLDKIKPYLDTIKQFGSWFKNLSSTGKKAFIGIGLSAGPVFSLVGKGFGIWARYGEKIGMTFSKFGGFKGIFGGIFGKIFAGVGIFMALYKNSESFRTAIGNLVKAIGSLLMPVFETLKTVAPPILKVIGKAFGLIGDAIAPIINLIAKIITWVAEHLAPAIKKHGAVIKSVFSGIASVIDTIRSAIQKVKDAWDKWKPKDKNASFNTSPKVLGGGGKPPKKKDAVGEKSAKGGTTLVGERGPELVDLPKGASVHPARETQAMMSPQVTVNMTNNLAQQGKSVDEIISEFSQKLREAVSASAEGVVA